MTPRIIFYCGRALEPWAPPSLATGIGGSETAVIKIASRFAQAGWRVEVLNEADHLEGVYDSVGYWNLNRLPLFPACDVLVGWRNPALHALPIQARVKLLWLHDLNQGPGVAEHLPAWDRVLGVSGWHADYLRTVYDLSAELVDHVPNGIDLEQFDTTVRKTPWQVVYASSPDRGLQRLLVIWRHIVEAEPAARLHVGYGWQNIDKMIGQGRSDLAAFKAEVCEAIDKTPGVVWRDRLGQDELARLYCESVAWAYPSTFLEVSCISAMSAMAGGCIPVTSNAGALKETVGDGGLIVKGNPYSTVWKEFYQHVLLATLTDVETQVKQASVARHRAKSFTWDLAFARWCRIVDDALGVRLLDDPQPIETRELVAAG